jgi:hypothetical protein
MRKLFYACTLVFVISSSNAKAQIDVIGNFLAGGTQDAEMLFEQYFAPWTNALGASLSGGWYNTAKPHKPLGFDLTLTTSMAFIPDDALTFVVPQLSSATVPDGATSPTIAGSDEGRASLNFFPAAGTPEIVLPAGTNVKVMASPMIQLGLGIVKETEIVGRYMPTLELGKYGSIGLWGIGLKHSIKQWIPGISKVPVFQLSIQGGYTKFNSEFNIDITPDSYAEGQFTFDANDYANQKLNMQVNSFTANLLVGANLPVISFYGGLGFATNTTTINLVGNYPIPTVSGTDLAISDEQDPISLEITNSDGSKTKPRMNIGFRLKFGVITLHGDYTYANYSAATAGLGISFR